MRREIEKFCQVSFRNLLLLAVSLTLFASCNFDESSQTRPRDFARVNPGFDDTFKFKDSVQANTVLDDSRLNLSFLDTSGKEFTIDQYRGEKNLVLVITRGFPGCICPYCSTQTSRLISNYEEFTKRDAEVLVVFPGDKKHIAQFLTQSRPEEPEPESDLPFPVLLDESFTAVDQLGIRGDRARPSTYILDKKGQVKFAYVGSSPSDRPSIAALLDILDTLED